MTKAEKISYFKNPFIGIFLSVTENYAVLPTDAQKNLLEACKEILRVEPIKASISIGSTLLGIYIRGNSNGIILPSDSTDEEISIFKKIGLNVLVVDSIHTAMGNLIAANDRAAVVNENLKEYRKEIEDCLNVEVFETKILPGPNMVITNRGLLLNSDFEADLKNFEEIFKVKGNIGTANFGTPFVGICIVANSKGFIVGEKTSGYEMGRIEDALGFLG